MLQYPPTFSYANVITIEQVNFAAVSGNGQTIFYCTKSSYLLVYVAADQSLQQNITLAGQCQQPAVSYDGSQLALTTTSTTTLYIYDRLGPLHSLQQTHLLTFKPTRLSMSRTGNLTVFCEDSGGNRYGIRGMLVVERVAASNGVNGCKTSVRGDFVFVLFGN